MATDKTPTHKRIQRAEDGREDWKTKASLRREENVKLNRELQAKQERLKVLENNCLQLAEALKEAKKIIKMQDVLIEKQKKNSSS